MPNSNKIASWPKVPKLDLTQVNRFLDHRGYKVISLSQLWRHVTGVVSHRHQKFFFKLAASPEISPYTRREVRWNRFLCPLLTPQSPYNVPRIYRAGLYPGRLYYYLSDYFGTNLLATKYPADPKQLPAWIPAISHTLIKLSHLDPHTWSSTRSKSITLTAARVRAKGYYVPHHPPTQQLLQVVTTCPPLTFTISHGDFVPWHMFALPRQRIGLVDGEHARIRPRYYDLSHLFLRIYVNLNHPDLARRLMTQYLSQLNPRRRVSFWSEFKPVLAVKTINIYWELLRPGQPQDRQPAARLDDLAQAILKDRLL